MVVLFPPARKSGKYSLKISSLSVCDNPRLKARIHKAYIINGINMQMKPKDVSVLHLV